ncbi:hypothetical protein B5S33_g1493 [[Candida] boidinii]|nr:hypothetical protein B5S30_g314 [[Candida] boidinii]OWB82865.1 hypothetical protein B5S33_g1493 [[Candida] boidinii]GMF98099.1 unnamed protein product [[Candida] boidinii]
MLTQEQLSKYKEEGCLAIPGFLDEATVKLLNDEIVKLTNDLDLSTHPMTRFTTSEDGEDKHVGDDYFINSSDKIHYFFEVDAVDSNGKLTKPKDKSINKIGHGLHFLNDKFNSITTTKEIAEICKQLGYKDPRALQSMVIIKQPEIGGKVPPHQDGEFLYSNPLSCTGFWFALEDCTLTNGCLRYLPGSHNTHPVRKRFIKDFENGGTRFIDTKTLENYDFSKEKAATKEEEDSYVDVEIPAGTLVLIHNSVMHKSERNTSSKSRNAYTFHIVEGESEYDNKNWLQVPPHIPSGTENFTKVFQSV